LDYSNHWTAAVNRQLLNNNKSLSGYVIGNYTKLELTIVGNIEHVYCINFNNVYLTVL